MNCIAIAKFIIWYFLQIECDENSDKKEPKWVLGALDSETKDLRIGLLPGNKRSRETIKPLLESFVKRGSTIISDCSSSFDFLDEPTSGFIHEKIDRSKSLVITKGDTKIHTNNIIATWRPFKDFFRTRRLAVENFHFALKVWLAITIYQIILSILFRLAKQI